MLFLSFFALFCVQSIWSLSVRDQLYDLIHNDVREVPFIKKEYLKQEPYIHLNYYFQLYYENNDGPSNYTGFADTWTIGNGTVSRSQFTLFANGNSSGLPYETIVDGISTYIIYQDGHSVVCSLISSQPILSYSWHYIGTRFITPEFDEYGVIWGPRLLNLYSSSSGQYTRVIAGVDAFNNDLVTFELHYNSPDEQLDEALYIHHVDYEAFDNNMVEVPITVQCLDKSETGVVGSMARFPFTGYF